MTQASGSRTAATVGLVARARSRAWFTALLPDRLFAPPRSGTTEQQPSASQPRAQLRCQKFRERFNAPELNLARYIKDGTVTDLDNGE